MLNVKFLGLVGALTANISPYNDNIVQGYSYNSNEVNNYPNDEYLPTTSNPSYPFTTSSPSNPDKGYYPTDPQLPDPEKQEEFGSDIKNPSQQCQSTIQNVQKAIKHPQIEDCFPKGSLFFDNSYTGCKPNCMVPVVQLNQKIVDSCFTTSNTTDCGNEANGTNLSSTYSQQSNNTAYHRWTNLKLVQIACQKSPDSDKYCIQELQQSAAKVMNAEASGNPVRNPSSVCTPCATSYTKLCDHDLDYFPSPYFGQINDPILFKNELVKLCSSQSQSNYS